MHNGNIIPSTLGLSIDYEKEQLYWISSGNSTINRCQLDGTKLEILEGVKGKLTKATALAIMGKMKKMILQKYPLCFVFFLFFSDLKAEISTVTKSISQNQWDNMQRFESISFTVGDKMWWADQGTDQIGTCDKKDGGNWKVLRNNTSPMMHMRIYDEDVQKGKKCCLWFLSE